MNTKTDFILGVVEGFYGVFYTFPERINLIRFIGQHGYTHYLYAPKNDRQQRARWWEPYPAAIMQQFGQTVQAAKAAGVRFCYAISPGGSICYNSAEDFERLMSKLCAFYDLGVRDFSLMLDDNEPGFRHTADAQVYDCLAAAQADLANRLFDALRRVDPACTLILVPADYSGDPAALSPLANRLNPQIDLCYTGHEICSPEVTTQDARRFAQFNGRKPLLWDNYPVNDLTMQPELHLAPITGRPSELPAALKGILVNPMIQAETSKIPLLTYAAYAADPVHYDHDTAWEAALREIAGEAYAAPLRLLAENANQSCLGCAGQTLDDLATRALEDLRRGNLASEAVRALEDYLTRIDEAGYALKFRLENLALRDNLLPWIEILEHWMWLARFSLRVLRARANGRPIEADLKRVREYRQMIQFHPKRIATQALLPLADLAEQVSGATSQTARTTSEVSEAALR